MTAPRSIVIGGGAFAGLALALALRQGLGPEVPVIVADDVEVAADFYRPAVALYVGGMGAKEMNFHFDVFCRMGWEAEATKIQDLYLAGHKDEVQAILPKAPASPTFPTSR